MNHGVTAFDVVEHHRRRTRRAEQRANALEHVRNRLERLLAITLRAACGPDHDPVALLHVIERIDDLAQHPGADYDQLAQLLRDTAPRPSNQGPKQEAPAAA